MEKYIKPFVDASVGVFSSMVGLSVTVGRPYLCEINSPHEWDISGVIGLTGQARGAVVLSMKKDLALSITTALTEKAQQEINEDVVDAVGELINIIAGNAKKGLESDFKLVISLPTIVEGPKHRIAWPLEQTRIICIPFTTGDGNEFWLSVALESQQGA
ncbi:MAG TPA: chemotaxis protein CheX [Treponema sp.]|nr:chemotaxis protein CheX [Treponema sp.]HPC71937.1 chemotaxis protein CheX [Treponema sp.]HRS04898.1 chemotaxis protein CheX [Treponema sp.]HRU29124.1 chemotaxis protein CheX [Treponema sp.]